jgi:mannitol/fructose-specific phosphotransferase system IIA component (Ntr-type)
MTTLCDLIDEQCLIPELIATTREEAISELIKPFVTSNCVSAEDSDRIAQSVLSRERSATTAVGHGIAVPHSKHFVIPKTMISIGCSAKGIDFASRDGSLVHTIFLVLNPAFDVEHHMSIMEIAFRFLQNEESRTLLKQAGTSKAMLDVICKN